MDSEQFDNLTRYLVRSRRVTLRAIAGGALGLLVAAPARLGGEAADKKPGAEAAGRRRRPATTCKVEQRSGNVVTTFSTKHKPAKLVLTTVDKSPLFPLDDRIRTTTVRRGRKTLLRLEETFAGDGRVTQATTYGPGFSGIDEMILNITGDTVSGQVDGRPIQSFSASSPPATFTFQDGNPVPEVRFSDQLAEQIEQLFERAEVAQTDCVPQGNRATRGKAAEGRPHAQDDAFDCLTCKGACHLGEFTCGFALPKSCAPAAALFGLGYAACLGIGAAACVAAGVRCVRACRESRTCCPVLCGNLPDWSCCFGGQQCLTFGTGFGECCPVGTTPCHETTCCPAGRACRPDGRCCPQQTTPCGSSNCCPNNEFCLPDGTCCRSAVLCNGRCCDSGICCNGVCCTDGDFCDGPTGRCSRTCRQGDVICPVGYPRDCCLPRGKCCQPGPAGPGGCCPPDLQCCQGNCVGIGTCTN